MNNKPNFSLCTVTFNRGDLFAEFVAKVAPLVIKHGGEWIIVDNHSSDNVTQILKNINRAFPELNASVVFSNNNKGMGWAYNLAVKMSDSENIIFSSYDIIVSEDFIVPLLAYLEKNPRVLVGPRLITFPAGWNEFEEIDVVPYVEGFMLAIKKQNFLEIGGWDENIFLDYEDVELSHRAREGGIGLAQLPLPVMHLSGQTFSTLNRVRLEITKESMRYFCKKWGLTPKNQEQKDML